MDTEAFKAACLAEGYSEPETKSMDANAFVDTHTHPFDVRALVLSGSLTLGCPDGPREYKAGDTFELGRDIPHTEQYGPQGYTVLVGRRQP